MLSRSGTKLVDARAVPIQRHAPVHPNVTDLKKGKDPSMESKENAARGSAAEFVAHKELAFVALVIAFVFPIHSNG